MIEIGMLAASVVSSFLVPLVKDGAEQLRAKLMEKGSESAATGLVDTARGLWDKIRGKSEGTDAQIVDLFEKDPDKMSSALESVVKSLLESDPDLHREVSAMVENKQDGSPSWQLMGTYVGAVDARGATFSGNASVAGVRIGSTEKPAEPAAGAQAPQDG